MAPILATSNLSILKEIKMIIRALLTSEGSQGVTLQKLNNLYRNETDQDIPFKDFNYTSLREFCSDIPDVLTLRLNKNNQLCAYHIDTEKTCHVSSLVAKQKGHSSKNKSSNSKKIHNNNKIDPYLLSEILKKQRKIALYKKKTQKISKQEILSQIFKEIGDHAFYTIDDLDTQLHEFTYLLNYDENFIYFKTDLSKDRHKKKSGSEIDYLIKETTQNRLKNLIQKYPKGIWCAELPGIYENEYRRKLEYLDIGFSSIIEFVAVLPHIFKIITPPNSKKHMVIDSRISSDLSTNHLSKLNCGDIIENDLVDTVEPIPSRLSRNVASTFYKENFMTPEDEIDCISVAHLIHLDDYVDVLITDLLNPTYFWVMLLQNKKKLSDLMNNLQEFYGHQDLDKYKLPSILLTKGLYVACDFAGLWHRGKIDKISNDKIIIFFCDYGTKATYKTNELYFLDKRFSELPAQSILCSLHNVKPFDEDNWSYKVSKAFEKRVFKKSFVAQICNIDALDNKMSIYLIDTSKELIDIYINEWMVENCLAEWEENMTQTSIVENNESSLLTDNSESAVSPIIPASKQLTKMSVDGSQRKILVLERDKNGIMTDYQHKMFNYPITFNRSKVREELKKYFMKLNISSNTTFSTDSKNCISISSSIINSNDSNNDSSSIIS